MRAGRKSAGVMVLSWDDCRVSTYAGDPTGGCLQMKARGRWFDVNDNDSCSNASSRIGQIDWGYLILPSGRLGTRSVD